MESKAFRLFSSLNLTDWPLLLESRRVAAFLSTLYVAMLTAPPNLPDTSFSHSAQQLPFSYRLDSSSYVLLESLLSFLLSVSMLTALPN